MNKNLKNLFYNCDFTKSPIYIIIYLLSIGISIVYLYYIFKLKEKKCKCSQNWRQNFILIYTFITLAIGIIMLYVFFCSNLENQVLSPVMVLIGIVYILLSTANLFYYITMFKYTKKLKENKCQCSDMWERELMRIVSIFAIVMYSLIILLYLVLITGIISIGALSYHI
jgi:hypothetical protein